MKGLDHHEASDAAQEVFQKLMRNEFLHKIGPERGRFRTYLMTCVDHYLASRWSRQHAQKRGGTSEHVELDSASEQPTGVRRPDQEFDYQWMLALVREVLSRLHADYRAEGREDLYTALKSLLVPEADIGESRRAAETLRMSPDAVRAALCRMRKRYKELFRQEIARTLANPFDVKAEIRDLLQVFQH
jgi:RNA polymerase sigma-70 factor (ECF subfamily)